MAVDPARVDAIAAAVADIYRDAETSLVRLVARHIDEGLDSPAAEQRLGSVRALRRGAQAVISALEADTGPTVRDALAAAYRHGWTSALADLPERWMPRSGIGQAAREALRERSGAGFVEALANALFGDLGRVTGNILRNVDDAYRSVQAAAAGRVLTGTQTRRQASQSAWQALVDRGITGFTDRAGRRWQLSTYVEMAARTNTQRAATQGQVDRLTSLDVDLVYVSDAVQECVLCRPWEGKILRTTDGPLEVEVEHATRDVMVTVEASATLDQAREAGLFHPNCRHSISAYLPGVTRVPKAKADPDGNRARERQREIERNIRKHKQRAEAALTDQARTAARRKVRAWQGEMRAHLAAHPDLKRLPYREQIGAGNIPTAGQNDPVTPLAPPDEPTLDGGPAPAPEQRTRRRDDDGPAVDDVGPGPDQPELEAPPPPRPRAPRELSDAELEAALEAALVDPDRADEIAALGDELDRRDAERRAAEQPAPVDPASLSNEDLEARMMAVLESDPEEFGRLAAELDRREHAPPADEPAAAPPVPPEIPPAEDLRRLPDDALQALLDAHQGANVGGVSDVLAGLLADPADDPTQRVYAEIEWRDEQRRAAPDPADLSDAALDAALTAAMAPDADPHAAEPIAAEVDRRDAIRREREAAAEERAEAKRARARERREQRDAERADRMSALLDEGWDEEEAVEEVYGISVERQRREAAIGRLRGEGYSGRSLDELARQAYRDYVYRQWRAAEDFTRGNLVTREGQARDIDPIGLFSGPRARADRWASDELKDWWDTNGRLTLADYKELLLGGRADESGRDFLR